MVTKVLAGRPKDLEDVRGVLIEQRSIDLQRVRALLGQLEATLEETRLLTRFERLLRRSSVGDAPLSQAHRKPR